MAAGPNVIINFIYSSHPNTGLSGFIEFYLMPVSTIWYPDHLKTGFRMASLDRFINKSHKKYFIHDKTV